MERVSVLVVLVAQAVAKVIAHELPQMARAAQALVTASARASTQQAMRLLWQGPAQQRRAQGNRNRPMAVHRELHRLTLRLKTLTMILVLLGQEQPALLQLSQWEEERICAQQAPLCRDQESLATQRERTKRTEQQLERKEC